MHLLHAVVFFLSAAVIWFFSGILIDATDRVAKRYNKPGFATAFFVLGFLTSISELSVATNATFEGVPEVSVGNLIGASIVILLLIIPLLAITGNGIHVSTALTMDILAYLLFIALTPVIFVLDGNLNRSEGMIMILLYILLIVAIRRSRPLRKIAGEAMTDVEEELIHKRHATVRDVIKILTGGILIFVAGKMLVDESVFFAGILGIPSSLVGLVVLSIGTNVPELVIALRCVLGKHKDLAFGDYMGSVAANTLLFGLLAVVNGPFGVEHTEFVAAFVLMLTGLVLFYIFARSRRTISRGEGVILLGIYLSFVLAQVFNIVKFTSAVKAALLG